MSEQPQSSAPAVALVALIALYFILAALTLGIVAGNGSAAHADERILDVDGPGFRASTLIGATAAVAAAIGIRYLIDSRRRARTRAGRLDEELRAREAATEAVAEKE